MISQASYYGTGVTSVRSDPPQPIGFIIDKTRANQMSSSMQSHLGGRLVYGSVSIQSCTEGDRASLASSEGKREQGEEEADPHAWIREM